MQTSSEFCISELTIMRLPQAFLLPYVWRYQVLDNYGKGEINLKQDIDQLILGTRWFKSDHLSVIEYFYLEKVERKKNFADFFQK